MRETVLFGLAVNAGTAVVALLVTGSVAVAVAGFVLLCVVGALDRIHAARRKVYLIALVGGTLCFLLVIPGAALSMGNLVATPIGVGIYTALLVWLCLNGMRKLDRDFEQARADTRELLAERR